MLIFGNRNPETAYPSSHFRGANEMLTAMSATPIEPLDGEAIPRPETAEEALEHSLAHELVLGAITIEECLEGLAEGSQYLDGYYEGADIIRFGGTTEVAPSVQARIQ